MEFQFLGTSSGTPSKTRNVSGLAIGMHGARSWCLVDCGEGTQHRILRTRYSLATLGAIFVTHIHGDHCYGLPGLLASAGMLNRTEPLLIAGPPRVRLFIEGALEATQLELPYPLVFADIGAQPDVALPDFAVHATPLSHRVPSYAYTFTERKVEAKLESFSALLDEDHQNVSGADIEAILVRSKFRALANGREKVDVEDVKAVVQDFVPPSYPLEIELQNLVAVQECTSRDLLPDAYKDMDRAFITRRVRELKELLAER